MREYAINDAGRFEESDLSHCFEWRPQGESNPRRRRERAGSCPVTARGLRKLQTGLFAA